MYKAHASEEENEPRYRETEESTAIAQAQKKNLCHLKWELLLTGPYKYKLKLIQIK